MKKLFLCAMLFASILCALPMRAEARTAEVFDTLFPTQLKQIMQGEGYSVTVDEDGDICWKVDGYKTFITFYSKNSAIQFWVSFSSDDTTLEKVNKFNSDYRFCSSYISTGKNGKKSIILKLDLDLAGGITEARLKDFLRTCRQVFKTWHDKVL